MDSLKRQVFSIIKTVFCILAEMERRLISTAKMRIEFPRATNT